MKNLSSFLVVIITFSILPDVLAQDAEKPLMHFPTGVSLEYGFGNYSVVDEYISKEKYSGSLPYYTLGWTKGHEKYVYRLNMMLRYSNDIKNYNVGTDIYQFALNQGFLYSLPEFTLFNKEAFFFLGPSTEFFFYLNNQQIAVSGFDYVQSFAALFSLGANSCLIYPISNHVNIESSLGLSVLSLGFRIVDSEETDESPVKPLSLFSGTNINFEIGIRYYLIDNISLKAAYLFNTTRISAWDPLLSASDNVIIGLTFNFNGD